MNIIGKISCVRSNRKIPDSIIRETLTLTCQVLEQLGLENIQLGTWDHIYGQNYLRKLGNHHL